MRTVRMAHCTTADTITVKRLLVFFGVALHSTRSSNICLPPPGCGETSRGRFVRPRFVSGCGSGDHHSALASPTVPGHNQRGGNSKTRVRSYHNSDDESKRERANHLAAHEEQHQHPK